jgi:hypothetical protein
VDYKPWAIDPEKMEQAIERSMKYQDDKAKMAIEKERAYNEGYRQASYDAIQMLHCSNCEKEIEGETNG